MLPLSRFAVLYEFATFVVFVVVLVTGLVVLPELLTLWLLLSVLVVVFVVVLLVVFHAWLFVQLCWFVFPELRLRVLPSTLTL